MLFGLFAIAQLILLANGFAIQDITFTSQHALISDLSYDQASRVRLTPSDLNPLPSPDVALKARPTVVYRPQSLEALHSTRIRSMTFEESPIEPLHWDVKEVLGPDVNDRATLAQLARMAGNAYALSGRPNWYEIDYSWNKSFPFGWEDDADGFRGHIFVSNDNSTVILSIKGTTISGPTSKKDKFNDNLALIDDSLFYSNGIKLMEDLIHLYPHSNIWLTGHSLGGALASLLGATYGFPAVAFESPGERLAASRLHLPLPPPNSSSTSSSVSLPVVLSHNTDRNVFDNHTHPAYPHLPITHVYHTSDPIPFGACTGFASPCARAGYALETKCHLGKSIIFDTVGRLGWHVDVRTHVIKAVITRILEDDKVDWGRTGEDDDHARSNGWWDWIRRKLRQGRNLIQSMEERREVPEAVVEDECTDCYKWDFGDFKDPKGDNGGDNDHDDDHDIPEPPDPDWFTTY